LRLRQLARTEEVNHVLTEAIAAGLALGSLLWWGSACLVGSFRPQDLAAPYWSGIPHLRTDTSAFAAFIVGGVCLTTSEYMRLRRVRGTTPQRGRTVPGMSGVRAITQSSCKTTLILATVLVIYLSVNAVTHPVTLTIRVTHLFPWPTEGTLRMIALALCAVSAGVLRVLAATSARG
jgi:hypothetical protein